MNKLTYYYKYTRQWLVWTIVIILSSIQNRTVVDFMGHTYAVNGGLVKRIR